MEIPTKFKEALTDINEKKGVWNWRWNQKTPSQNQWNQFQNRISRKCQKGNCC